MTVMVEPNRALMQRQDALTRANEIRSARRQMKEDIKAGELSLPALIRNPPPELETAKIGDVVEWGPGIGYWRANRILAGMARPTVKVGSLGDATRRRIATRVEEMLSEGWMP